MRRMAFAFAVVLPQHLTAQSSVRDSANAAAAQLTAVYTGTLANSIAGGVTRGSVVQEAATLQADLRLRTLIGWKGARLFVSVIGSAGPSPDPLIGDLQGVLSTVAPPGVWLEEAWLEQNMLDNRVSLLVGRYDVNAEFYRLQSSASFLNSSFGIGPELGLSGVEGPSIYPFTAIGTRVEYKPTRNAVFRAAVMDGVPVTRPDGGIHLLAPGDGAFAIGELAILSRPTTNGVIRDRRFHIGRGTSPAYAAKLALGVWGYTTNISDLADTLSNGSPVVHDGSAGAYVIGDAIVWRRTGAKDTTLLALFGQFGIGDPMVNAVGAYAGGGVSLTGPLRHRASDQLGLGVASAQVGSHYRRAQRASGVETFSPETVIELTYLANVARWITLHPDVQYVLRPGGNSRLANALVPGLQITLSRAF
jgi:porin